MRKHLLVAILSQLVAFPGAIAADEQGWFLEPSFDAASYAPDTSTLLSPFGVAGRQALSLHAGYRFNASFTVQAMFFDLAPDRDPMRRCHESNFSCGVTGPHTFYRTGSYTLSLVPALALHDDLAIYGHLGIQGWNVEANGNPDLRKRELLFGVGLGYDVSNPLRLQLEYRSLDLDIKLTSVGFSWRF